jgi:hypothetical protein
LPVLRSQSVRTGGALGSENAGMSSVRDVSKRPHRMAEVSAARFILGGLVGPKPRPKGVGDGQTVDIPSPRADEQVRPGDGARKAERGAGDAASNHAGRKPEVGESEGATRRDSVGAGLQEKPWAGSRARPYRKPTLVAGHEYAKGNG